ncbi:MAG: carboxypeptidase-like regulatory domain-containing protein [Candidatus Acidiferrales bacterium]
MSREAALRFCGLALVVVLVFVLFQPNVAKADTYATIRGTVTDQTGAAIPDVAVTVVNVATGLAQRAVSSRDGSFAFLQLAIGDYTVKAEKSGFKTFATTKIHLDVNQVYTLAVNMQLGVVTQEVMVQAEPVQVNTGTPQLGAVVTADQIVDLPLINRDWVNLQQTMPGVVGASDGRREFATNGSQSQQNSFLINGTDTNDLPLNTRLIIPSPDAIAEFRMVTGTINPEYGRNSGAIVNALIKGGTNSFHGDAFEFYRDPFLNTRNFFSPQPDIFHQNLFGATIGGPVIKNHTFFFFSYQGLRARQPQVGVAQSVGVFTPAERGGDFSQGVDIDSVTGKPLIAESKTPSPFPMFGDQSSACPASGGTPCAAGTPYNALFSTGKIPTQNFNTVAANLMKNFVPLPNSGDQFQFNPTTTSTQDQYLFRIDQTFNSRDSIWGTWLQENHPSVDTLPFTGATVPGFAENAQRHYKLLTLSWSHVFNDHILNELHGGYTRFNFVAVNPVTPVLPSTAGFAIIPQDPGGAGLPVVNIAGLFSLGFSSNGPQPRKDQTYEAVDNFSITQGRHSMKFGFDMRRFQVYNPFFFGNSGTYTFNGAGTYTTTDPGADFLLGIPDSFGQGSGGITNARAQQYYSYAQDEYKLRSNLTLTFGVGWQIDTPIVDNYYSGHGMVAFIPNKQSTLFTNAPLGYVFQGEPGVNAAGTSHAWRNWGPRFGFAYSPNWGWLSGGPGRLSIRGGYGIYYNRSEEEQTLQFLGMPPFTVSSAGAGSIVGGSPSFANPYVDIAGKGTAANPFPFSGVVPRNINFAPFEPLWQACCGTVDPKTVDPMAENYNLTLERQFPGSTIVSLGYVGAVAHHLSVGVPVNTATPAGIKTCLADPKCDSISQPFLHPNDFLYDASVYGPIDQISSLGSSNYNSFQATVNKRLSHGVQFYAAYTWSHSLDDGSGFENTSFGGGGFGALGSTRASNPYCRTCDYGNSIFDAKHRLVFNALYRVPNIPHTEGALGKVVNGWAMAGIATYQSGFPLDVIDSSLQSLTCMAAFSDFACPDVPNVVAPVTTFDPRSTPGKNFWFSKSSFALEAPGTFGNAGRDLFRGPGINNWDFELYKDTHFTESMYLQLRIEFYNVFNHTQFDPAGISTNVVSSRFGRELRARSPRQIQLATKFYF